MADPSFLSLLAQGLAGSQDTPGGSIWGTGQTSPASQTAVPQPSAPGVSAGASPQVLDPMSSLLAGNQAPSVASPATPAISASPGSQPATPAVPATPPAGLNIPSPNTSSLAAGPQASQGGFGLPPGASPLWSAPSNMPWDRPSGNPYNPSYPAWRPHIG